MPDLDRTEFIPAPAEPPRLGKYELRGTVGSGASGTVFDAWDPDLERRVAIKQVVLLGRTEAEQQELKARFRKEAQLAGRLSHSGVVAVYDYGEQADSAFLVMEFVQGESLASALRSMRDRHELMAPSRAVAIAQEMLVALDACHRAGVLHRDIKPGNVMLAADGSVKLTDFGIARGETSELTVQGTLLGTPSYMSPEQFEAGGKLDARSDLYACGVVLYELLTGRKPFDGDVYAVMHQVRTEMPPAPSSVVPAIPSALDAVVLRALAKRPSDRYPDAASFSAALREALSGPSVGSPTRMRWLSASLVGAVVLALLASQMDGARLVRELGAGIAADHRTTGASGSVGEHAQARGESRASPEAAGSASGPSAQTPAIVDSEPGRSEPLASEAPEPATGGSDQSRSLSAPRDRWSRPGETSSSATTNASNGPVGTGHSPTAPDPGRAAPSIEAAQRPPVPAISGVPPQSDQPAHLPAGLAFALARLPCAAIFPVPSEDGLKVTLQGLIGSDTANGELARLLAQQDGRISEAGLRMFPSSASGCLVADLVRAVPPSGIRLEVGEGRKRLIAGETITAVLRMPDFAGEVLLDYVTDAGRTVVHLSPSERTPARYDSGLEVKLGPKADGVIGTVGAPYGTDLILVTVSGQPLGFLRNRPGTEPAGPYLRALVGAVADGLRKGQQIAADATALETAAQ